MDLKQSAILEQDLALKEVSRIPQVQKPQFAWRDVFPSHARTEPQIRVLVEDGEKDFDYSEVAETIGRALTNLALSRKDQHEEIFSEQNRSFVERVARDVGKSISRSVSSSEVARVTPADVYRSIACTLEEHRAYDVAKSFLQNRAVKLSTSESARLVPGAPRIIKRNNQVVPWNEVKIETAIRKAFLSLQRDSAPSASIARAVTERVVAMNTAFLHIEQVQDIVQEEIMRSGHFKVAEHYILYRAARNEKRVEEARHAEQNAGQNVMVLVKRPDGTSYFWDGLDLRRRIEFARIGLDLCLDNEEIEMELRRSVFDDISQADLNNTIVLNA
jgi:ribonucleoside-diphosphate reductase alpha chain